MSPSGNTQRADRSSLVDPTIEVMILPNGEARRNFFNNYTIQLYTL
jgi:hypothetical protein